MSKILKIKARQVFDSRGNPTIEAEVYSKKLSATAICPQVLQLEHMKHLKKETTIIKNI